MGHPSNAPLFNAVSVNANKTSNIIQSDLFYRASFQFVFTSTSAAGTLQLQASNDQAIGLPANQFTPTNWSNVGTSVTVNGSTALVYLITEVECSYEYMKVTYADTSGGTATGTLSGRVKALGI